MRLVVIVPFLDEEPLLPAFLESVAGQSRRPDRLVLVDDGSSDRSFAIASAFAQRHDFVTALQRPPRPHGRDRLSMANELRAFLWALEHVDPAWDVVAKMDADLRLTPETLASIEGELERDPTLGLAGSYLCEDHAGELRRLRIRPEHVHGATKFYRRACFEEISPLPTIVGWDMIDEVMARVRGWRTQSFAMPDGDPLHLRRRGSHSGLLRGFRRWGEGAYALGEHPLHVVLHGIQRMGEEPRILGGLNYVIGWASAALRGFPRAEPRVRRAVRADQLARVRRRARRLLLPGSATASRSLS